MTQDSSTECPYKQAGLLSKATLWWICKYLAKALKRPLQYEDIQGTDLPWMKTEKQVARFSRIWPHRDSRGRPASSLAFALVRYSWKELAVTTLLAAVCEGLKFVYPVLIVYIIGYFEGRGAVTAGMAWLCAVLMLTNNMFYAFLQINYTYFSQVVSMQLRTTCSGLIYKKILQINLRKAGSPTYGHITALLATDVERFEKVLSCCQAVIIAPVMFVGFVVVEYHDVGMSSLAGAAFILGFECVRFGMGKLQSVFKKWSLMWTDRRMQLINELLTAIRSIKIYCWEKPFAEKADKPRQEETKYQRFVIFLDAFGCCLNHSAGAMVIYIIVVSFIFSGHQLTPMVAVKLIALIRFLEAMVFISFPTSIVSIFEALVSVKRIERFLLFDENLVEKTDRSPAKPNDVIVHLNDVSATWEKIGEKSDPVLVLDRVSMDVSSGELVVVIGTVGAGKTSLLMTLLGEIPVLSGDLLMRGSVALVPQEAWVLNMSLKDNVLLGKTLEGTRDHSRYQEALEVCQLKEEIARLPDSDTTLIGERGITLSGGQKARLNMARAVYADADIYLLDNPLSAVDANVASNIFDQCICGTLQNKLRFLITHNLEHLTTAHRVIVMEKGQIVDTGTYEDLSSRLRLADYTQPDPQPDYLSPATPPREEVGRDEDLTELLADWDKRQRELMMGTSGNTRGTARQRRKGDRERLLSWSEKERKVTGGVSGHVYLKYFRSGRSIILGPLFIISLFLMAIADIFSEWWLADWYHQSTTTANTKSPTSDNSTLHPEMMSPRVFYTTSGRVWVLTIILVINIAMGIMQSIILAFICIFASRSIYKSMFYRVLRAPMHFFETNSLGAVLNRFTRDTALMDIKIPSILAVGCPAPVLGICMLVYICLISPWATVGAIPLIITLPALCYYIMGGIRDLKRIEANLRSPTFTHLSATLQGLPVIRAFHLEEEFSQKSSSLMDKHANAWFIFLTAERFLSLTTFMATTVFHAITVTIMLLLPQNSADAGPKGLALTYIRFLIAYTRLSTVKFTSLETYMTSVERLLQYSALKPEGAAHTDVHPAPGWPQHGDIRFSNVCLQYKGSGGQLALGPLSLHIYPGQKVGVVGRTGAGKTSLFSSLLRLSDPTGSIRIDGLETRMLGLTDLRSNVSTIPQDPILFSGSLRSNLDPSGDYDDNQLWTALGQVQMESTVRGLPGGLYTEAGQEGDNFSSGQKQLLCLARVLLRKNKIIMIDEATSNVDHITDSLIQETLTNVLVKETVICIAHRLNTVISYDKVLVLDKGKRVQYDHPYKLLQDSSGLFHQMVQQCGDVMVSQLTERARVCYEAKQLSRSFQRRESSIENE